MLIKRIMETEPFDAIIIGSGQGGTPLAKKMATAGRRTLLIEKNQVGGCCVNYGCSPTKTLISSARVAYQSFHSSRWGVRLERPRVDFPAVMARKQAVVRRLREGAEKGIRETAGLTFLCGTASFLDEHHVRVVGADSSEKRYSAPVICIDTGAEPRIPELEGLSGVPYLTSTTLLEIDRVPAHLLILGGSYLGLEFAQMFRRFASQVTVLEKSGQLLPKEDPDMAEEVKKVLTEEGIRVITTRRVTRVSGRDPVRVETDGETIEGSHLLVATGRLPATGSLDLARAHVRLSPEGFIPVNERLETTTAGIFAMGDVTGGPAFTHIAYNDHLIIAGNLLEGKHLSTSSRQVPYCMFTDPQFARVGMSETEARAGGKDILVASLPMAHTSRGIETGHTRGIMKAVVEKSSGRILGAAFFGDQAGEVMSVVEIAMHAGMTAEELRAHVFAHPLYAESLNNLFMSVT
jgi:pyruvate/2-oxoglutarate dehydrogenase complex dihydrolipoamide dehydrogenase (E3) component